MMEITTEDLYREWHKQINLIKGRHVRPVKNFSKAKSKETWKSFIYCTNFINRNCGQIDYILYIKSLAEYYNGWIDPKFLGNHQSITIYKDFIKKIDLESSTKHIIECLRNSIIFVVKYCRSKGFCDLSEYVSEDIYLISTLIKHLNAGSISIYFLAAIPEFDIIWLNYPIDVRMDYFPNFDKKFKLARIRLVSQKELSVWLKIDKIVNKMISL